MKFLMRRDEPVKVPEARHPEDYLQGVEDGISQERARNRMVMAEVLASAEAEAQASQDAATEEAFRRGYQTRMIVDDGDIETLPELIEEVREARRSHR